jgi:hypothetical protein
VIHVLHFAILFIFWFYVILFLVSPIVLHSRFRYGADVDPRAVSLAELPAPARDYLEPRVSQFAPWNFELIAYVRLWRVIGSTEAYMALLSNPHTNEWADVTFVMSAKKNSGYIEFTTRCSEQMQIDTNTNATAPVLFALPVYHVFRFPQVADVFTLYRLHRMLVNEITHGALPVLPSAGDEIAELKRRLGRYGPWQQDYGYMYLDSGGENYRLTWKGAILGAWRSIWPITLFRNWRQRTDGRSALRRVGAQA